MTTILQTPKIRGSRTPKQRQRDLNVRVRNRVWAYWGSAWRDLNDHAEFIARRSEDHLLVSFDELDNTDECGVTYEYDLDGLEINIDGGVIAPRVIFIPAI